MFDIEVMSEHEVREMIFMLGMYNLDFEALTCDL